MRMIDDMRVVWTPGRSSKGSISIESRGDPQDPIPDDERLGYALCTINGTPSIRIWRPAVAPVGGDIRDDPKGPDGAVLIRASYVSLPDDIALDVQTNIQNICRAWMAEKAEGCARIPIIDKRRISDILNRVARLNGPANPIYEIAKTTDWDGTPRMTDFFVNLGYHVPQSCGLTPIEEAYYIRCCARFVFLALIERQIRATLFDLILILHGDSDLGKTTTFEYMANGFVGTAGRMPRDKTAESDRSFWVRIEGRSFVVFSEGEGWTHYNNDTIKTLLSEVKCSYVRKYENAETEHDIQCIFGVTTNDPHIIKDPDGNTRRFLPLQAVQNGDKNPGKIILELLQSDPDYMDQIYAEALCAIESAQDRGIKSQIWRAGDEHGNYARDAKFIELQKRVCRESVEIDGTVQDLADYIKDRLSSNAIDAPETVKALTIETEYRNENYNAVAGMDWAGITKALHKTAKLYGLKYDRYKLDGKTVCGYRLDPAQASGIGGLAGSPASSTTEGTP